MAQYNAFHCTTTGNSHIVKNTRCEDYSGSLNDGDIHIAVVSDGHGDGSCFRSQVGSRLAVEAAVENLYAFARNIRQEGWENRLFQEKERERLMRQLIRSIVGGWNIRIRQDLKAYPITEEEFAESGDYTQAYRNGQELAHIYGCTLIAALVTDRYLVVLHQGDGRCVVIHQGGNVDQPVPWDDLCVGNITTSMCHEDTVTRCRYYVADLKKDPILACFAASDGIEDNLADLEAVNVFFCNVASIYAQDGEEETVKTLRDYMPQMSRAGNGDDTSIAGVVSQNISPVMAERLSLAYELHAARQEARYAQDKVNSMQRKNDYLRTAMVDARAEYDRLERECNDNRSLLERLFQEVQRATQFRDSSEGWLENARKKLEEAHAAYDEYNTRRNAFIAKAQAAQTNARMLQERLDALNISTIPPAVPAEQEEEDWEFPESTCQGGIHAVPEQTSGEAEPAGPVPAEPIPAAPAQPES